jgi:hypothetical protein
MKSQVARVCASATAAHPAGRPSSLTRTATLATCGAGHWVFGCLQQRAPDSSESPRLPVDVLNGHGGASPARDNGEELRLPVAIVSLNGPVVNLVNDSRVVATNTLVRPLPRSSRQSGIDG